MVGLLTNLVVKRGKKIPDETIKVDLKKCVRGLHHTLAAQAEVLDLFGAIMRSFKVGGKCLDIRVM